MATNIFLGMPPETIKQFIIENYSKPEEDNYNGPIRFMSEQDGSSVSLVCYGYDESNDYAGGLVDSWCEFEYSMTGKDDDWAEYTTGQVVDLNKGETVYLRAKQDNVEGNPNLNGFTKYEGQYIHKFVMEGLIKADGNIQFLLENTGTIDYVPAYCYYCLFSSCTSLTQAPALPATTLAYHCYAEMFFGCTALTQAPVLPATTLAEHCYHSMFSNCTALTNAPEFLATTLAEYCCNYMFQKCTSLNNVNVNFSDWDPSTATLFWLEGVASEGTFTCPTTLPDTPRDGSRIPEGWTRINK